MNRNTGRGPGESLGKSLGSVLLALLLPFWAGPLLAQGQGSFQPGPDQFSPPLGFRDGHQYAPHYETDANGNVVEDTRYGVQNPDLAGNTCFGVPWEQLYHSGEDLYRTDGAGAEGAEVTAAGDGVVVYANPYLNYPGLVVIVEHTLSSGQKIYSLYAHIDDTSLAVTAGQQVTRGQRLGTVMYQRYTGRFPERHPSGDDSHLHFEMRYFFSGRDIYQAYPACNGLIAGRGYTYPDKPDDFPAAGAGYVNPDDFIPHP